MILPDFGPVAASSSSKLVHAVEVVKVGKREVVDDRERVQRVVLQPEVAPHNLGFGVTARFRGSGKWKKICFSLLKI